MVFVMPIQYDQIEKYSTVESCLAAAKSSWQDVYDISEGRAEHILIDEVMTRIESLYRKAWQLVICDVTENSIDSLKQDDKDSIRTKSLAMSDGVTESNVDTNTKKRKLFNDHDDLQRRRAVGDKLALLLLQTGRAQEADEILQTLGYTCRIAESILNYHCLSHETQQQSPPEQSVCRIFSNLLRPEEVELLEQVFGSPKNLYWTDHNYSVEPPSPYVSYLIPVEGSGGLDDDFNVIDHEVIIENDIYNKSKNGKEDEYGMIGRIVRRLKRHLAKHWNARVEDATFCEMWAHNRPYTTGHQFHFDSDNEGRDSVIRHPICSTVIYLNSKNYNSDTGHGLLYGPSVITNQRLASRHLADKCWVCFPSMPLQFSARLNPIQESSAQIVCAFDGSVLHGVIPGLPLPRRPSVAKSLYNRSLSSITIPSTDLDIRDSEDSPSRLMDSECCESSDHLISSLSPTSQAKLLVPEGRRVTVMFAFWRRIRVRDNAGPLSSSVSLPATINCTDEPLSQSTPNPQQQLGCAARLLPTEPEWARELRRKICLLPLQSKRTRCVDHCNDVVSESSVDNTTNTKSFETNEENKRHEVNNNSNEKEVNADNRHQRNTIKEIKPIYFNHVYETIGGKPWTKNMGFPNYDQIFQGF